MEDYNGTRHPEWAPNNGTGHQNDNTLRNEGRISEEEARKMILESYERAGVDLPLVTLETVLSTDDDAPQPETPPFKRLMNKASAAISNRGLNSMNSYSGEGPDDEFDPHALSTSYTSNTYVENETRPEIPQEMPKDLEDVPPHTPQRFLGDGNTTENTNVVVPATPELMKGNTCHPAFDFCCPEALMKPSASPTPIPSVRSSPSDKYVVSKLQIAEGFDDEKQSADDEDVPALMDGADSLLDETYISEKSNSISKPRKSGFMSYFRGSRRFRIAIAFCCLLHFVLIGLIIAFILNLENEKYEAGKSSSALSPGQTVASSPSSTNIASEQLITSKTLAPDPDLDPEIKVPENDVESEADSDVVETNDSTVEPINSVATEEDNVFEEKVPDTDVQEEQPVTDADVQAEQPVDVAEDIPTETCVDSVEVNMDCVGEGSDLLVFFESCAPRVGDWVGIYESSANPAFLVDTEAIGWLYTCGDRFCEEVIEKEVLSFSRAAANAGVGTFRAHLIREGEGPTFSALASSPDFRIVANADRNC